ncbi:DUF4173 domain-containing protein [Caulobacter sp. UNC279MFTsu5.1]|uniref:DUF4153 domain-containing protein n=1 Tax=Caulobacter sp. UNC279MFTsu5.1 TaxID=1502775 RepID=UPI0008F1C6D5|nr:DUF4173 domain-containing protein [Caulobacter sp. UNC279MFTsu5.1]SFI79062.1 protein of unknown function [Caulobacter sp. UNC279MFTsu5.1]
MPLSRRPRDLSFALKVSAALALAAVADQLFWGHDIGATLGGFALLLTLAAAALHPAVRRDRKAGLALAFAAVLALVLAWAPSPLAWILFWAALSLAVLLPRTARFDDAWRWSQRLVAQAAVGLAGPWLDLGRARKAGRSTRGWTWRGIAPLLALPVAGGAIFLALFAAANPVIGRALSALRFPDAGADLFWRALFWLAAGTLAWGVLRPRRRRALPAGKTRPAAALAGVSVASMTLSLIVFNALFALQNGLDAVILWGGAGPPAGLTLAEYAHRGAYPLIATALLAGLFVLVALDPRRPTAEVPLIRVLVVAWVAQNLFLVASSILRTVDYVQAYSLTRLRIAALVWMGLVALGLVLICWRMLRGKSGAWLINANATAAVLVLVAASVVDLGAVAAAWNVRHARDVGGRGPELDVCYLERLGPSALVSLVEAERRSTSPELTDRVAWVRERALIDLRAQQGDWRAWTARDALRLARVEALERQRPLVRSAPAYQRECDGRPVAPPPPELTPSITYGPAEPLTPAEPVPD